jgi:pimeloyl-ACP methyl ester carboxylesterase
MMRTATSSTIRTVRRSVMRLNPMEIRARHIVQTPMAKGRQPWAKIHRVCGLFLLLAAASSAYSKGISSQKLAEQRSFIEDLTNHVIRADRDGFALHADTDKEVFFERTSASCFAVYVSNMLARAELWNATHDWNKTNRDVTAEGKPRRKVRLLIHVHGGLNSWDDTVKRMDMAWLMMHDANPDDRYYPIFVAWPSAYFNCYNEHLVSLRQGNRSSAWWGYPTAPMIGLLDLCEGLVNTPLAWTYQLENSKNRLLYNSTNCLHTWLSRNQKMGLTNANREDIRTDYKIWPGYAAHSTSDLVFWQYGRGLLTTPFRATLGTLAQGPTVGASWQVMKRRTGNLFHPPDLFEMGPHERPGFLELSNKVPAGDFFTILADHIRATTNELQYEITFVGHSMGTIVLNRLFGAHGQDWVRTHSIDNIVYMGAACSVWQGLQAVVPVLKGYHRPNTNAAPSEMKFYNLTLHPLAEMSEEMFWPAAPAGSLLHLIDTHLESPNGPLDRTLGSQVNVFSGIEAFAEVKPWCVFKGFDFIPDRLPAEHGDFNKCPFWRKKFWMPTNTFELTPPEKGRLTHVGRNSANQTDAGIFTTTYPKEWQKEEQERKGHTRSSTSQNTKTK